MKHHNKSRRVSRRKTRKRKVSKRSTKRTRKRSVRKTKGKKVKRVRVKVSKASRPKKRYRKTKHTRLSGGGTVGMDVFGLQSGRYSANPSSSYKTAYGKSRGVSMGTVRCNSAGPNLGNSLGLIGGGRRGRK